MEMTEFKRRVMDETNVSEVHYKTAKELAGVKSRRLPSGVGWEFYLPPADEEEPITITADDIALEEHEYPKLVENECGLYLELDKREVYGDIEVPDTPLEVLGLVEFLAELPCIDAEMICNVIRQICDYKGWNNRAPVL